ncbi:MAG: hypothetical protein QM635_00805 [Microbacteriaceae bacterium]
MDREQDGRPGGADGTSVDSRPPESPERPRSWWRVASLLRARPVEERGRALKEQVYASFTGLAIVTVFALDADHTTTFDALLALFAGIVGITIAGFVAEVLSHLVVHRALPTPAEVRTMARIAGTAIASASVALITLGAAWLGLFSLGIALQVSVGIYLLTLGVIALVAAYRTGLPWRHQLIAFCGLVGLGAIVVPVLVLAH